MASECGPGRASGRVAEPRPIGPVRDSLARAGSLGPWRRCVGEAARSSASALDAVMVLRAISATVPTRLGAFEQALVAAASGHCSPPALGAPPAGGRTVELLPVHPLKASAVFEHWAADGSLDPGLGRAAVALAESALLAVSFFACAGWTSQPVCLRAASEVTKPQLAFLGRLWAAALDLVRAPPVPFRPEQVAEELRSYRVGYGGEVVSRGRELVPKLVILVWPKPEETCILPIVQFVGEELRQDLENPERCLLPRDQWPQVTPRSRVYASDADWYELVAAGAARGLFGELPPGEVFCDARGDPVVGGAMGVDKPKEVDGVLKVFLRFICIFTPINGFMRRLRGDCDLLPFLNQLSLVLLEDGEVAFIDSEDMVSCFNVFVMPEAWARYFSFEKLVPRSAFGGPPGELARVYMRGIPMGWIGAVDVVQAFARRLVFQEAGVAAACELRKDKPLPAPDVAIVCMDGFDYIARVQLLGDVINEEQEGAGQLVKPLGEPTLAGQRSEAMVRFVSTCKQFGIPLNWAKRLVRALRGPILGGEFDGLVGTLRHGRQKALKLICKSVVLVGEPTWSQGAVQHWAGLFCFAAGFRRVLYAAMQEVFPFIQSFEVDGSQKLAPPLGVLDEVIACACLLPLAYTNLRAPIRRTISSSDASPSGGGAAEAKEFVQALRAPVQEQAQDWIAGGAEESRALGNAPKAAVACSACAGPSPLFGAWASCPFGCPSSFCSHSCLQGHVRSCAGSALLRATFGEGFAGARAPLTWAVACEGRPTLQPFDRLINCDHDFFQGSGRRALGEFDQEKVGFEHWAPCCKLMCRARGKPISLQDGRRIAGPAAVRSEDWPRGLPGLSRRLRERLRDSNRMFDYSLLRLEWRIQNLGFAVIEHPFRSLGWWFPQAVKLAWMPGVFFTVVWACCHGGKRRKGIGLLHNCPRLHQTFHQPWCPGCPGLLGYGVRETPQGQLLFDTEEEAEYPFPFCRRYAKVVAAALGELEGKSIPAAPAARDEWILQWLARSTPRLAKPEVIAVVAPRVLEVLRTMVAGDEEAHLRWLLRRTDHRGSDVRLLSQTLVDGSRQEAPYPALAWNWETVAAYPWRQAQHINVLEFVAFLSFVRQRATSVDFHSKRFFHVFDSRVAAAVAAKGRSSSKVLNRPLRRYLAYALATDTYVLALWTISAWNFADAASRLQSWDHG